ncbi:MAG: hypothetical protein Q4C30_07080 [Bacteroidia bacterium]|nr:hypothetical protein [Bacteroidia bacterium]
MPHPLHFQKVKYLPFIGSNYFNEPTRILILGVKIYAEDPLSVSPNACTEIIESSIDNVTESFDDTIEHITNLFRQNNESHTDVWNRMAFYNFTQVILPDSKSFPTQQQIDLSTPAYIEILQTLKPHKVILWGQKLYNNVLCNLGNEALRIDNHETWMVDINELTPSQPVESHIVHSTFVNDPSDANFDTAKWRHIVQTFLSHTPTKYKDPQISRRVKNILKVMNIDYSNMVTKSNFNLPDLIAKAITVGILHFEPENAITDAQYFKAENNLAASHFADCLRNALLSAEDDHKTEQKIIKVAKLLMSDKYTLSLSAEDNKIEISSSRKADINSLWTDIQNIRRKDAISKPLSWNTLEKMFRLRNMRQNLKSIHHDKDYIQTIDDFFKKYR